MSPQGLIWDVQRSLISEGCNLFLLHRMVDSEKFSVKI